MRKKYGNQHQVTGFKEGDVVLVAVPSKLRRGTEASRLPGRVFRVRNHGYYEIQTRHGVISNLFLGNELIKPIDTYECHIPSDVTNKLPLSAVVKAFLTTPRPKRCGCKGGCHDNRCSCRKANVECTSRCHRRTTCSNQAADYFPPALATPASHKRRHDEEVGTQNKRQRCGMNLRSATLSAPARDSPSFQLQAELAAANEVNENGENPPRRLRKLKRRKMSERAHRSQAGEE